MNNHTWLALCVFAVVGILGAFIMLAPASDGPAPARAPSKAAAPAAKPGPAPTPRGQLTYADASAPTTLHPLFAKTMVDRRSQELIFDRLFYRSAVTNQLKSRVVDLVENIDNGRSVRVRVKPGIQWHDGKPLTAKDICFTVDAIKASASPLSERFGHVVGCTAEDATTALIPLDKRYVEPRERIAFPLLPAHKFDTTTLTPDSEFGHKPIGTGPMMATRGSQSVRFAAAPNGHHSPHIDTLLHETSGDPYVHLKRLVAGNLDGVISVPPKLRADIAASDDLALRTYDLRSWWFIALNTGAPHLSDPRIRQALNLTLDRGKLLELTTGITAEDLQAPAELISGPFLPESPYYNKAIPTQRHVDPKGAADLMRAAGAVLKEGVWELNGKPITIRLGIDANLNKEAIDLANQVGNQLGEGGFGREVYNIDERDWRTRVLTGRASDRFDAVIGKWSMGVVEDVDALFQTRDGKDKGSLNIFNYSSAMADGRFTAFRTARTDTLANAAYHDLHAHLAQDLPYLFLWKLDTKSAWRTDLKNAPIAPYYYFTEFDQWRME